MSKINIVYEKSNQFLQKHCSEKGTFKQIQYQYSKY